MSGGGGEKVTVEASPASEVSVNPGSLRLHPPTGKDILPEWIKKLLEYYEYVGEESRTVKEKGNSRNRTFFTLRCTLCKNQNETQLKGGKKRKKDGSLTTTAWEITGCASYTFARHLERAHPDHSPAVYDSNRKAGFYKRTLESKEDTGNETILPSLIGLATSSLTSVKKYNEDSVRQKEFRETVLNYIALDGAPLCTSEGLGFRLLMQFADPKLTCPSRRTISRLLDTKSIQIQNDLRLKLADIKVGSAHLLLDIWSSRQNYSVIGVQVRFIKDWRLYQHVIGFKHFPGSHDATNIRQTLQDLLSVDYGLSMTDFATVTADNASAILAAFKDLNPKNVKSLEVQKDSLEPNSSPNFDAETQSVGNEDELTSININQNDRIEIEGDLVTSTEMDSTIDAVIKHWSSSNQFRIRRNSCLAHLLQLAIKDAFRNKEVDEIIKKVNSVVTWFHKSDKQYTALRELSKLGLIKPCDTRWNSFYHCLKRLCRKVEAKEDELGTVAKCVNKILRDTKKAATKVPSAFSEEDLAHLEILMSMLKPFAELTDLWQGNCVNSSLVILSLIDALKDLEEITINDTTDIIEELLNFKMELKQSIMQRFGTNRDEGQKAVDKNNRKRNIITADILNDEHFILATLLDPRVKTGPFEENYAGSLDFRNGIPSKAAAIEVLKKHFLAEKEKDSDVVEVSSGNVSSHPENESTSQNANSTNSTPDLARKKNIFERVRQFKASKASSENATEELDRYIGTDTVTQSPLRFWGLNEERYPILSRMAVKYLSMPATSACVERLFSVAGSIIRARRASISIETTEKLICYRECLRKGLVQN